jgi:hypothetical protein
MTDRFYFAAAARLAHTRSGFFGAGPVFLPIAFLKK